MEHPLNQAHFQARQAEQYLKQTKYDLAIECHQKAVELLDEVLAKEDLSCAHESIKLQRDDHVKQQGIIRLRQHQAQARRLHAEKVRDAKFPKLPDPPNKKQETETNFTPVKSVQSPPNEAVFRTIAETDSLLYFLQKRKNGDGERATNVSDYIKAKPISESDYKKLPKDDKTIIEELRCHNAMLTEQILSLLKENDALREKANKASLVDSCEPEAFCDLPLGATMSADTEEEINIRPVLPVCDVENLDFPPLEVPPEFQTDREARS